MPGMARNSKDGAPGSTSGAPPEADTNAKEERQPQ